MFGAARLQIKGSYYPPLLGIGLLGLVFGPPVEEA